MSETAPAGGFTLASLNLHCGRDRGGVPYPVAAAVRALSADVVALQEDWRVEGGRSLAEQAAEQAGYPHTLTLGVWPETSLAKLGIVADGAPQDEPGSWGLAVLSRIPLQEAGRVDLGVAPGDDGPRMALLAVLAGDGGPAVRLACTHLTHRLRFGPGQLRTLVGALRADPMPTVIAGDLNMCRPTVRTARGFRPVVRGRTWPAERPIAQLDHLLAGRDVRASGRRVLDPTGSDHRPVRATLTAARG